MHSFAAAAAFREKRRGEKKKKAEYGHKAYLYITWRYSTFSVRLE